VDVFVAVAVAVFVGGAFGGTIGMHMLPSGWSLGC
jgi:hypothetical protein